MVFPLIDVTTSPGFVALPPGMFSVRGTNPKQIEKYAYYYKEAPH